MAMSTDDFHSEQILRDLYYSPKTGYRSDASLYGAARARGSKVTHKQVREWLERQTTYVKFKSAKKPQKYRKTFVKELGDQIQMDLVDMQKFKSSNDDTYWILTAIEIMSRYAFAVPVRRKETADMTAAVETVLRRFSKRFGRTPDYVQFDDGKEFKNIGVRRLLTGVKIKFFSTGVDNQEDAKGKGKGKSENWRFRVGKKASVVERFNRTLKNRMWKYFEAEDTSRWLEVLDDFVEGYNTSVHSTIEMKPADVDEGNVDAVFVALYGYGNSDLIKPKFKVGDRVRVEKYKNVFARGFDASFTDEVFTISEVYARDPCMYKIMEGDGTEVAGRFYESEIAPEGGETLGEARPPR